MVVRRDGDGRTDSDERAVSDGRTETADGPPRSHLTTILLEERSDGSWRATQHGVAAEGRGETAAAAAAAYCSTVAHSG